MWPGPQHVLSAGFFLPFMAGPGHARRAIEAAEELMRATGHGGPDGPWVPLGAAVHTGVAFVGLVSRGEASEFTALGDPINVTAHLAATLDQARLTFDGGTRLQHGRPTSYRLHGVIDARRIRCPG